MSSQIPSERGCQKRCVSRSYATDGRVLLSRFLPTTST
jgi:hypothetical protein